MATKRTPVQRLRPLTQQSVIVRPVNTYVQPAPVQEGKLRELSNFINRIEPRVNAVLEADRQKQKEEDKKAAIELAKTTTASYDDLVKQGKIDPAASPVFRYAFNETRGSVAGFEYQRQVMQDYARSGLDQATDSSGFNDWFNEHYTNYVTNNQAVLGLEGAFGNFDNVANQARQNLMSQHISTSNKNFKEAQDTAYNNFIYRQLESTDWDDPVAVTSFTSTIALKQTDLQQAGGPNFNYSVQNKKTVDALVDYYTQAGYDIEGLEKAMGAIGAGTGPLSGTAYARNKVAEARVDFAQARFDAESQRQKVIGWNKKTTLDNIHQVFMNALANGERNVNKIMLDARVTYGDEVVDQWLHFHPKLAIEMDALKDNFVKSFTTEPMSLQDQAILQQNLLQFPPDQQIQEVVNLVNSQKITDSETLNKLMNLAVSNAQHAERGQKPRDATKDSVASTFRPGLFTGFADNFTDAKAIRFTLFKTDYFELYHRRTIDGSGYVWDQLTQAEKFQKLVEIMERAKQIESIVNADGSEMTFQERQQFMNPSLPIPEQPDVKVESLSQMK